MAIIISLLHKPLASKEHYSSICFIGLQDKKSPIKNQLQELLEALENKQFFLILKGKKQYELTKENLQDILERTQKDCLCITDQDSENLTTTKMSSKLIDGLWPQPVQQPTTSPEPQDGQSFTGENNEISI